jgi:branched-subunit amino acid ABC-type transport system permease component
VNERITFIVAALVGDLSASVFVYLIAPLGPLCVAFPSLLSYAGQHGPLAAIVWLVTWTAAWLTMGPRVMRLRQNLSSKIQLLAKLGFVGLVIDNAVSLFQQYVNSPELARGWWSSSVFIGLVERSLMYVISFVVVVLVSYLISRTRKPIETPPPDFGRE